MYRALQHQLDAEYADARTLYLDDMAERGENPDALNMLALVQWHLGNLDAARQCIGEAARLAPGVPAIQANERLIDRACALRDLKHAIFDPHSDTRPALAGPRPRIHICEIAGDPSGGTEHRAIELANRLRDAADVVLWTQNRNLPSTFTSGHAITLIDESRGVFPQGGTLLVCGSYIRVGNWFRQATFRRVVVLYNVVDPIGFSTLLQQVCIAGKPKVELLFASDWMKSVTGLPGSFEPSPIDTDLFAPGVRSPEESGTFVVGRLSRDDPVKFHPAAAGFFRTLASQGCQVKLMGATPILAEVRGASGVEVLRQNSVPAVEFLRSLDCFTYRTHPSWTEAWGRVVTEAMSVGIPMVAHADGGYAQIIRHGENGFLFHRDSQALELVAQLRRSPALRKTMGANARQTIVDLCGPSGFARFARFYLQ